MYGLPDRRWLNDKRVAKNVHMAPFYREREEEEEEEEEGMEREKERVRGAVRGLLM